MRGNPNWKKGVSGNPKGRDSVHQSFIERARYLLETHTIKAIKEFTKDDKKFDELSVYDGMVMRRIVEAVADNGKGSMDSLLDRLLGKPPQYIETKNDTTVTVTQEERKKIAQKEADEMLLALSKRLNKAEIVH